MDEKEIKNGDVYGKLDFDSDEKVVLPQEVTMVKIDGRDVELPVEALNAAGWRKVNDDENVVKKVELSEKEAQFMESHKHLSFYEFSDSASIYVKSNVRKTFGGAVERRLNNAYFNGYTVKESKYYIKMPEWFELDTWLEYLSVYPDGYWELNTRVGGLPKRQFTQKEIDVLQKDDRAKSLDLNALKVKVPDSELED